MSGTGVAATPALCGVRYWCPVLTQRMALPGMARVGRGASRSRALWAYAPATACPVLTRRMAVPDGMKWAAGAAIGEEIRKLATELKVLSYGCATPSPVLAFDMPGTLGTHIGHAGTRWSTVHRSCSTSRSSST
eukprot:2811056-Rhodomonas_salina.1